MARHPINNNDPFTDHDAEAPEDCPRCARRLAALDARPPEESARLLRAIVAYAHREQHAAIQAWLADDGDPPISPPPLTLAEQAIGRLEILSNDPDKRVQLEACKLMLHFALGDPPREEAEYDDE